MDSVRFLEAAIQTLQGVQEVAVIGIPDERWQERPLAAVVRATEADAVGFDVIAKDLMERVPRWWIPTIGSPSNQFRTTQLWENRQEDARTVSKGIVGERTDLGIGAGV